MEVYNDISGEWGTINSDGWQKVDTDVACQTLGFVAPHAGKGEGRLRGNIMVAPQF